MATADVTLAIDNPNGYALDAEDVRYRLAFEDRAEGTPESGRWLTIAEGESRQAVSVPGDGSATVTLAVPFRYADLGRAAASLLREGTLTYRLDGEVRVGAPLGTVRIPFDETGQVGLRP